MSVIWKVGDHVRDNASPYRLGVVRKVNKNGVILVEWMSGVSTPFMQHQGMLSQKHLTKETTVSAKHELTAKGKATLAKQGKMTIRVAITADYDCASGEEFTDVLENAKAAMDQLRGLGSATGELTIQENIVLTL